MGLSKRYAFDIGYFDMTDDEIDERNYAAQDAMRDEDEERDEAFLTTPHSDFSGVSIIFPRFVIDGE